MHRPRQLHDTAASVHDFPHPSTSGIRCRSSSVSPSPGHNRRMPSTHPRALPGRPLIDFVTNEWRQYDDVDASDEDEAFYFKEEDHLIHPRWKEMATQASNRVPRRMQRVMAAGFALLVVFWAAWSSYFGPRHYQRQTEMRLMDATPDASFGANMQLEFAGMIQVGRLDSSLLPTHGEGPDKRRLVVVGDVHGCREELSELLQKVEFDKDKDHLIFTGDMVAKGPDSPGVVSLAQSVQASCVRGNHEDRVLLSMSKTRDFHIPLQGPEELPGRTEDTIDEEFFSRGDQKERKLAKSLTDSQLDWLQQCPVILRVGQIQGMGEVVVVHAGLIPSVPLERQDPFSCMNMRSVNLTTHMPLDNRDGAPWEKLWNYRQAKLPVAGRSTVVYGHDARRGRNLRKYSRGLDSGCVHGGELTALVIEAGKEEAVSVSCQKHMG